MKLGYKYVSSLSLNGSGFEIGEQLYVLQDM